MMISRRKTVSTIGLAVVTQTQCQRVTQNFIHRK